MTDYPNAKRPDPIDFLTGRRSSSLRPGGISLPEGGGKFASDGSVLQWPGNTFICYVDPKSSAHDAIRSLLEDVKMSKFARFFAFLPPSSFHMTVFQGISPGAAHPPFLPHGAQFGLSRDALSALILKATNGLSFPASRTAKMQNVFCGHSLTVTGAGPEGDTPLRDLRIALRDATGITPPDFDEYVFHVTLSYLLEWLTEPTAKELVAFSTELTAKYAVALAEIPLGPVEFCNFETMHHFEPLRALV